MFAARDGRIAFIPREIIHCMKNSNKKATSLRSVRKSEPPSICLRRTAGAFQAPAAHSRVSVIGKCLSNAKGDHRFNPGTAVKDELLRGLFEFNRRIGHRPTWSLIAILKPWISSSVIVSTVPALPSVSTTAFPVN